MNLLPLLLITIVVSLLSANSIAKWIVKIINKDVWHS